MMGDAAAGVSESSSRRTTSSRASRPRALTERATQWPTPRHSSSLIVLGDGSESEMDALAMEVPGATRTLSRARCSCAREEVEGEAAVALSQQQQTAGRGAASK